MNLIPQENIIYRTKLAKEEIYQRLCSNMRFKKQHGRLKNNSDCLYRGNVYEDSFSIERCISGRNSFLPKIKGAYAEDRESTTINVTMKLSEFVLVSMILWLIGVFAACVGVTYMMITEMFFDIMFLIPYIMLLFGVGISLTLFKTECNKSRKDLQKIFEAEIVEQQGQSI